MLYENSQNRGMSMVTAEYGDAYVYEHATKPR